MRYFTNEKFIELLNAPSDMHPAAKLDYLIYIDELLYENDPYQWHGNGD